MAGVLKQLCATTILGQALT